MIKKLYLILIITILYIVPIGAYSGIDMIAYGGLSYREIFEEGNYAMQDKVYNNGYIDDWNCTFNLGFEYERLYLWSDIQWRGDLGINPIVNDIIYYNFGFIQQDIGGNGLDNDSRLGWHLYTDDNVMTDEELNPYNTWNVLKYYTFIYQLDHPIIHDGKLRLEDRGYDYPYNLVNDPHKDETFSYWVDPYIINLSELFPNNEPSLELMNNLYNRYLKLKEEDHVLNFDEDSNDLTNPMNFINMIFELTTTENNFVTNFFDWAQTPITIGSIKINGVEISKYLDMLGINPSLVEKTTFTPIYILGSQAIITLMGLAFIKKFIPLA